VHKVAIAFFIFVKATVEIMKHLLLLSIIFFVPFTYGQATEKDSTELKIQEVALSFHSWYINAVNSNSGILKSDFAVVKGSKGKCQIDSAVYFTELRTLGTISEKFLRSEQERFAECANHLSSVKWKSFQKADAYTYSEYCPSFDYYYWLRSQEQFYGAFVEKVEKEDNLYKVTLALTYDTEDKNIERSNQPIVTVENENGKWMITEIGWK
jgi:hypothetical protein